MDYSTGTETILLVEDEDLLRHVVAEMLSGLGYQVLSATNGQRAIQTSQEYSQKIEVLITDVLMPDLDGMKLAKSLVSERPELRVLFISGSDDENIPLPSGMARLQKPFTIKMLSRKIRELMASPRPR